MPLPGVPRPARPRRLWRLAAPAAVLLAAAGVLAGPAAGEPFAPDNTPTGDLTLIADGVGNLQVSALARTGDTLLLGGRFGGIGHRAPALAPLDPATGDTDGLRARFDPLAGTLQLRTIAPAPDGGVFVGGTFAGTDGVARPRLLRLGTDTQLDTSFKPNLNFGSPNTASTVTAMAYGAGGTGTLYVAGAFSLPDCGEAPTGTADVRVRVAALDAETGATKCGWIAPQATDGAITELAVGDQELYLAGSFKTLAVRRADGTRQTFARPFVAGLAVRDGALAAWNPAPNGAVDDLAVDGSTVYLGGVFTRLGEDTAQRYLAAVGATGAGTPSTTWLPNPSAEVTRVAVQGATVYAGGRFSSIGAPQVSRNRLAALASATAGRAATADAAWNPGAGAPPTALLADGDTVYVGIQSTGQGTNPLVASVEQCGLVAVGGVGAGRPGVAVPGFDAGLATRFNDCKNLEAQQVVVSGLARTTVTGPSGAARPLLWTTGYRGSAETPVGPGFEIAGLRQRRGLAAIDLRTNQPLPWNPMLGTTSAPGRALDLAVSSTGTTVYVGGTFTGGSTDGAGAFARRNTAAFSFTPASRGGVLAWAPDPDNTVRAVALSPGGQTVYLGGSFTAVGGFTRPRVAAVAAAGAGGVVAGFRAVQAPDTTLDGSVFDLVTQPGGRLFVAGTFTRIGGAAAAGVGALDAATGVALPGWNAGLAAGAQVFSLAAAPPRLVLGGAFTTAAPGGPVNAAAVALDSGAVVPGFSPATSGGQAGVLRVSTDPGDGTVYLDGGFQQPTQNVAAVTAAGAFTGWDPQLGRSRSESVDTLPAGALLLTDPDHPDDPARSRLALGGSFTTVGGRDQAALAFFASAVPPTPGDRQPAVDGVATPGRTLRCAPGTFGGSPGTSTWTWIRRLAGSAAEQAVGTSQTYDVHVGDLGFELRCRQTVANAAGTATQLSDWSVPVAYLPPSLSVPPAVAGQAWTGGTARCSTGLWQNAPTEYRYGWLLDGAPLVGETAATHVVGAGEEDHRLACEVVAANPAGAAPAARSAAVLVTEAPPVNVASPLVAGATIVGGGLTCDPGTWIGARTLAYQWLRDGVAIDGATAAALTATSRDLGHALTCAVTAASRGGTALAVSASVRIVASPHSAAYSNRRDDGGTSAQSTAPRVDVRSLRFGAPSKVVVKVFAPAAGRLTLALTTLRHRKAASLARATKTVARRQTVTVTLRLGRSARASLRAAGAKGLKVSLSATFRPRAAGATQRDRASSTLKLAQR